MIKIKLTNYNQGRNNHTFRPFMMYMHYFSEMGVQFVDDGSCDIEFIGMANFIDRKLSLDQSIINGISFLQNRTGPFCLFDGSDSSSLLGAYEVFVNSNAKYLFKTVLTTQAQYKIPTAFNKWFFGPGSALDIAYDITDDVYANIKLTGWNLGHYNSSYLNFIDSDLKKDIDVCAIYQGHHDENCDHLVRNDTYYTNHRTAAWGVLKTSKDISYEMNKRPYGEFINSLQRSKSVISPYGMGEICYRDFEAIQYGTLLIKPDMQLVNTYPNIYVPYVTYIPCRHDWADLETVINWVKEHPIECAEITANARRVFKELYSIENVLLYWYKIILTFENIQPS